MKLSLSRRGFLQTAGAGAVTMWIPNHASGYTAAEMRAKAAAGSLSACPNGSSTRRRSASISTRWSGTSRRCGRSWRRRGVASRPHAKTHKCPAIAKLQLATGSIGVCAAKVSEAEALFANGIEKILMTTSNVTANKIRRAMQIRKANRIFIQAVDYPQNAQDLSDAAKEAGIVADVVVDVAVGTRIGVPAGEQALALAQLVDKLPNLKLRGMISYDGGAQHIKGFKKRSEETLKRYEPSVGTFER